MENFETTPGKVKEKSVYLLHLDTPRIIILASVVIGVIIVSFLFGMNFIKGGDNTGKNLAQSDMLSKPLEEKLTDMGSNKGLKSESSVIAGDLLKDEKSESVDVLTNDNINEIIPPVKKEVKKPARKVASSKKKTTKKVAKKKHSTKKRTAKKSRKRSRVVEVSSERVEKSHRSSGYSIQIASYDSRSKADREAGKLKKQSYDSYVDRTTVKGKRYYRVRIGPLTTKRKAINLLNDIQENDRYAESYMVKE